MGDKNNKTTNNFFKGKIVILYIVNAPEAFSSGVAIYKPKIEEWHGRNFLTGEVPSNPSDWSSGLRIGVALDQVGHFLEFADEKEFVQRMSLGGKDPTLH